MGYDAREVDRFPHAATSGDRLLFQERTKSQAAYYALSWRSSYPGKSVNRRFYYVNDRPWSTDLSFARKALDHAEATGWLAAKNHDRLYRPELLQRLSTTMNSSTREKYLSAMVQPGEEFEAPEAFVICEDSTRSWRKAALIKGDRITFRSAITDPHYSPRINLDNHQDWDLDNTMQTSNVQQTVAFLSFLREYQESTS